MRVLIDCNIIVSAAIGKGGVCLRALSEAQGSHTILVSEEILAEYRRVANSPKFPEAVRTKMHALIEEVALSAEPLVLPDDPPATEEIAHKSDLVYVVAAHVGRADAIITGNFKHFTAPSYGGALVVSANEFLRMAEK